MRSSLFYPVILGYAVGVFLSSFFQISLIFLIFLILVFLVLVGISFYSGTLYQDREIRLYSYFFVCCVAVLCISLGFLRYWFFSLDQGDPLLLASVGKTIDAEGVITEEPDVRENAVRLTVTLRTLHDQDSIINLSPTKIILSTAPDSNWTYGDEVSLQGMLTQPENFDGDNGRTFDYISYLAKDRIFYQVQHPTLILIAHHQGNPIKEVFLSIKAGFLNSLDRVIAPPESALAAGLIIAGKRALPTEIQNEFQRSGTLQVVVLSGYNVTVVAETLTALLSFLPQGVGLSLGALGIVAFTITAGATATVVRASITALIVILGKFLRRRYDVPRALVFSGFVMLIFNPMLLVFDPSFQLSFLSTLGLILMSPIIEKYFFFVPEKFNIRATTVATIATQLFVTPFLLYLIGSFSVVSVPANLLIFLFIPSTMLVCFVTGIFAWVNVLVAAPFAYVAFALLWYELGVVRIFSALPFASLAVPLFPAWLMVAAYIGYAIVIWRFYARPPPMKLHITRPFRGEMKF